MEILSWNVAGLRAMLKKETFELFLKNNNYDIICLQETKAEENQVKLSDFILENYPYRFWNSTKGTTQRKGLSGTCIWCKEKPLNTIIPDFDEEGRILVIEYDKLRIVNIYVPNSQKIDSPRIEFRKEWNKKFYEFIETLKDKEIIICGDLNVAHLDIDICNPKQKKNKVPGFYDFERADYQKFINDTELIDVFRKLNIDKQKSTYWSNFLIAERSELNGWGIDYFISSNYIFTIIKDLIIHKDILGSDHAPLSLILSDKKT